MDMAYGDEPVRSLEETMQRSAAVGVTRVVQVGCDLATSEWAVAASGEREDVVATVALHPNEAPRVFAEFGRTALEEHWARIAELAAAPRVRAIGETGLDFFRTGPEGREVQEESFRFHIKLAKQHGLPLMIHDRDAHDDVVRVVLDEGAPETVIFHCFSGDESLAKVCEAHGWYASFAGTVTYKNAEGIRAALRMMPAHLILTETDAPFLPPVPYRGQVNASELMPLTVRHMADERGADLAAFCQQVQANAFDAFGHW
jgi:TatD DNase family protein